MWVHSASEMSVLREISECSVSIKLLIPPKPKKKHWSIGKYAFFVTFSTSPNNNHCKPIDRKIREQFWGWIDLSFCTFPSRPLQPWSPPPLPLPQS